MRTAPVDLRASEHGPLLVDGTGRTLYLFEGDSGATSNCIGVCASGWPPYLTSGDPQAGSDVSGRLLGPSRRDGGGTQATYRGHPLYYYSGDGAAGDASGQGLDQFGANWYVVDRAGNRIDDD